MERASYDSFLGEILMVSFAFAPKGWALCNGQLLPINQNQALFSLLGTTYGGNGQTHFALPDLRGRVPIHMNDQYPLGQRAGEETHLLTAPEMPAHSHGFTLNNVSAKVGTAATSGDPVGRYFALSPALTTRFSKRPDTLGLSSTLTTTNVGGSQAHTNLMPSLSINFIINLQGLFPSQN